MVRGRAVFRRLAIASSARRVTGRLGRQNRTFQRMLIEGWARAAVEVAPERAGTIADWLRRRREHLEKGRSRIVVNHVDMVAW